MDNYVLEELQLAKLYPGNEDDTTEDPSWVNLSYRPVKYLSSGILRQLLSLRRCLPYPPQYACYVCNVVI